jgi:hypothetical protein
LTQDGGFSIIQQGFGKDRQKQGEPHMKNLIAAIALVGLMTAHAHAQGEPDMLMPKATIRGVVLMQDGQTPVDGLRVRVWNAQTEEIVFRSVTNDDGLFEVPDFTDSGSYYVTVGPVKVDLRVLAARGPAPQHNGFVMVLPKSSPVVQTLTPPTLTSFAAPALAAPVLPDSPQVVSP